MSNAIKEFTLSSTSLNKLTVPQLKALCKERKITGYSKLSKAALVQKLLEYNAARSETTTTIDSSPDFASQKIDPAHAHHPAPARAPTKITQGEAVETTPSEKPSDLLNGKDTRNTGTPSTETVGPASMTIPLGPSRKSPQDGQEPQLRDHPPHALTRPLDIVLSTAQKRTATTLDRLPAHKRLKRAHIASENIASAAPVASSDTSILCAGLSHAVAISPVPRTHQENAIPPIPVLSIRLTVSNQKNDGPLLSQPRAQCIVPIGKPTIRGTGSKPKGSRFKALVIRRPLDAPSHQTESVSSTTSFMTDRQLHYLDMSESLSQASGSLSPISLPPKKSQRKHVTLYALIFTYLDAVSLKQCVLAARVLRYAVYISASYTLKRDFSGKRFDTLTKRYSPSTTNMWPYLRARKAERTQWRQTFNNSFLATRVPSVLIHHSLWASPNHAEQITMSLRFLLTRLWFSLSIGGNLHDPKWTQWTIIDAQEVIPTEIWSVVLRYDTSHTESLLVLAPTCEVIGTTNSASTVFTASRVDWNAYIQERLSTQDKNKHALLDFLSWPNHEEYDKGVSKLWLQRIRGEGELGRMKRLVGERYILASLMANSISGRWMTSSEMDQELSGLPEVGPCSSRHLNSKKPISMNLFLPTHHHIESVHFTTPKGVPLHPSLAVVQTPGREYYILRDNGMQIGCEEDGVADIWRKVIGCTAQGIAQS